MASRTWSSSFLGRCSIVSTDLRSRHNRHTRLGCLPEYGLTDKLLRYLKVLQASGTMAIREPHAGERLSGLTDRILAPHALAPQVEWAFWCGQCSVGFGQWGLKNGSQASGV